MLRRKKTEIQNKKKGQSTVEYIILVAAVLAALLIFLGPKGAFVKAYNNVLHTGTNSMEGLAGRLSDSYPLANAD